MSRLLAALAEETPTKGPAVPPSPALVEPLSTREMQVLRLLATDLSTPEIAERLVISRSTVKVHISNILSKLGVASRAEAISLAIQNKLVK